MTPSDTAHPEGETPAVHHVVDGETFGGWNPDHIPDWLIRRLAPFTSSYRADQLQKLQAALALAQPSRPQGEEGLISAWTYLWNVLPNEKDGVGQIFGRALAKMGETRFIEVVRAALSNQGKPSS